MDGLTYVGNGAFKIGIPARDMSQAEAEWICVQQETSIEALLASGLYIRNAPPTPPKSRKKTEADAAPAAPSPSAEAGKE